MKLNSSKHFLPVNHIGFDLFSPQKIIYQTSSEHIPDKFTIVNSSDVHI